ncbi:MAG: PEGA domain-containing protein [Kofleriaceae bacterium]|nr:PEGA domain-containing protein [Kofleriaceae bacterium]
MGRLVLAGTLLVAFSEAAEAGSTRKVEIVTDPPGATVYIDDPGNGAACDATPCTINAPLGTPTIIIRLDKFEPIFEPLDVPKGKKPLFAKWKLKGALGTIVVDSPRGATVQVDGEDKGKAPIRLEVSAEPHQVVVYQAGKKLYDEFLDVATGDEVEVKPNAPGPDVADTGGEGEGEGDGDGDGGGSSADTGITGQADSAPRTSFLTAGVVMDVGFRSFTYDEPMTGNLRSETEGGQVILGPVVELFPMRLAGSSRLRGLSIFGRAQFGVRGQQLTGGMLMGQVSTFWGSYELSVRHRWNFGALGIEASGGYVRDQMRFNATNGNDINLVPDAEYQSIRIGAKLSYNMGDFEPYLAGENRVVLDGGVLATRFADAKATGMRGALGALLRFGPIIARAEASLVHYSWEFQSSADYQAAGATDSVKLISVLLGYAY